MHMQKSDQINEITTALSASLGEIENATKSSNNPHFKSKYADLAEVTKTVREVWPKYGLAYTQGVGSGTNDKGKFVVAVTTLISHKSGQWIESTLTLPCSKEDAQGVGSAITYGRRYALAAAAGIAQEDDDGNAASKPEKVDPKAIDALCQRIMMAPDFQAVAKIYSAASEAMQSHPDVVAAGKAARERFTGGVA